MLGKKPTLPTLPLTPTETLFEAAETGDAHKLLAAIRAGANARASSPNHEGFTALMLACKQGRLDCAQILLPLSDPKARAADGRTALILCAHLGHLDCLELLLPVSEPEARVGDNQEWSALSLACLWGRASCAIALLPHSDPRAAFPNGETPRRIAIRVGNLQLATVIEAAEQAWEIRSALPTPSTPIPGRAPRI